MATKPRNSDCPDRKQLKALLEARLAADEETQLVEHISNCDRCQQLLDSATSETLSNQAKKFLSDAGDVPSELAAILSQAELDISESTSAEGFAVRESTPSEQHADRAWADIRPFMDDAAIEDKIGQLGEFRVTGFLGRGGMGAVFEGIDPKLNRRVAIKVLSPALLGNDTAIQRFLREAQAVASISNPSVIGIYAVEHKAELPFFAMEYVDGQPLDELLEKKGRLPPREVLRVGYYMASGLAAAHDADVIHRDVKPANVLIENGSGRVRLLDFGLARSSVDKTLTASGALMGTPAYMAPETIAEKPQDERTDLFSLGAVMYHMLSGELPFEADTAIGTIQKISSGEFEPLRRRIESAPAPLCEIIEKLLQTDPNDRFQSAAEVAAALKASRNSRDAVGEQPGASLSKPLVLSLVTVAVVIIAAVLFWNSGGDNNKEAAQAAATSAGVSVENGTPVTTAPEPEEIIEPATSRDTIARPTEDSVKAITELPKPVEDVVASTETSMSPSAITPPEPKTNETPKPPETPKPTVTKTQPMITCRSWDGETEQKTSLAAAFRALEEGGRIELPGGVTWKLSRQIELEEGKFEVVGIGKSPARILAEVGETVISAGEDVTLELRNLHLQCSADGAEDLVALEASGSSVSIISCRIEQRDGLTINVLDNSRLELRDCEFFNPAGSAAFWMSEDTNGTITVESCAVAAFTGITINGCGPDTLSVGDSVFVAENAIVFEVGADDEDEPIFASDTQIRITSSRLLARDSSVAIFANDILGDVNLEGDFSWTGSRNTFVAPILSMWGEDEESPVQRVSSLQNWTQSSSVSESGSKVMTRQQLESLIDFDRLSEASADNVLAILKALRE